MQDVVRVDRGVQAFAGKHAKRLITFTALFRPLSPWPYSLGTSDYTSNLNSVKLETSRRKTGLEAYYVVQSKYQKKDCKIYFDNNPDGFLTLLLFLNL